jgi:hypothetical protein
LGCSLPGFVIFPAIHAVVNDNAWLVIVLARAAPAVQRLGVKPKVIDRQDVDAISETPTKAAWVVLWRRQPFTCETHHSPPLRAASIAR